MPTFRLFLFILALLSHAAGAARAEEPAPSPETELTGEQIYFKMCASCHGKAGEGVEDKYEDALYGERSIASLAKLIDKTMPEDAEERLDAEGSLKVAEYIYHAFYSPEARARNNPPRIDLARLTNRQFRESVADLLGSFIERFPPGEGAGLKGQYFQSDGMNKKSKAVLERVDKALDFDFGDGPPVENCAPDQFSIAWQGSLLVEETGFYDFRLSTPNGARLYLNRDFSRGDQNFRDDSDAKRQPALIDDWVSSGDMVRVKEARVFLLGGRSYPIRLDYFKFKENRGMVKLEWKPPHGVWRVLSAPYISPENASRVSVVTTTFPPDDRGAGYERGTSISKEWLEAATRAAIEVANEVVDRLNLLAKTRDNASNREEKVKAFAHALAERAFRRPLTEAERAAYVDKHFEAGLPPEVAVKRVVMLVLKSPRFLYPDLSSAPDDYTVAARLALFLWDSLPDVQLTEAAAKGELRDPEQVRAQARRMMNDPRAKAKLRVFFHHWLAFDSGHALDKDPKLYPDFDEAVAADLRVSLEKFVDGVVWGEASDFRQLLLANTIPLNARLAKFLGVEPPSEDENEFKPVAFDPALRAGVLTHPYLLATFANAGTTSPIHRGVFLTRNVLGRFLKPPPVAVAFQDEKLDPSLTMREKVAELTKDENCMACHGIINPLGFTLEHYDAVGRWRDLDNHKPVDAVSQYVTVDDEEVTLRGPRDLAEHAAGSRAARRGFIQQLFQQTVKQPHGAFGADTVQKLEESFVKSGYHIRNLLVEIVTAAALHGAAPPSSDSTASTRSP